MSASNSTITEELKHRSDEIRINVGPLQTLVKKIENKKTPHHSGLIKKHKKRFFLSLLVMTFGILIAYLMQVPVGYISAGAFFWMSASLSAKQRRMEESATFLAPDAIKEENTKKVHEAEVRLAELKALGKKDKDGTLEPLARELETHIDIYKGVNKQSEHFAKPLLEPMQRLKNMPCRSVADVCSEANLSESDRKKRQDTLMKKVKCLLTPYSLKIRKPLINFASGIIKKMYPMGSDYDSGHRVKSIFIKGPRGIGKGHLVNELAKIFDIPLAKVDLGKVNLDEIEGKQLSSTVGGPTPIPSFIMKALTDANKNPYAITDMLLFIDEIDKAFIKNNTGPTESTAKMIAFLLSFLQTDISTTEDKGFNIPLNIRNLYIALVGNRDCFAYKFIDKGSRGPLHDRVNVIAIPDLTRTNKILVLKKIKADIISTQIKKDRENKRPPLNLRTWLLISRFMDSVIQANVPDPEYLESKPVPISTDSKRKTENTSPLTIATPENALPTATIIYSQINRQLLECAKDRAERERVRKATTGMPASLKNTGGSKNTTGSPATLKKGQIVLLTQHQKHPTTPHAKKRTAAKKQIGLRTPIEQLNQSFGDGYDLNGERIKGIQSLAIYIEQYLCKSKTLHDSQPEEPDSHSDSETSYLLKKDSKPTAAGAPAAPPKRRPMRKP